MCFTTYYTVVYVCDTESDSKSLVDIGSLGGSDSVHWSALKDFFCVFPGHMMRILAGEGGRSWMSQLEQDMCNQEVTMDTRGCHSLPGCLSKSLGL